MEASLQLPVSKASNSLTEFRHEVRAFIQKELDAESFQPDCDSWLAGFSREWSMKMAEKGWVGMTFPKEYGGQGESNLKRYVVTEEMLAAGAPVAAHWIADRQTGPLLLKYGTEYQKQTFLPGICKGEVYFSIGLSEPNAGSDLANIHTKAVKESDEWLLNGSKIWTSGAHLQDYMIVLCRTEKQTEKKHEGLSQFIVDLRAKGVSIRPITLMTGEEHFNEVFFENVRLSDEMIVGKLGEGWKQGMAELAFERSGPERFLSTYPLLEEMITVLKQRADANSTYAYTEIGKLVATLVTLRRMSFSIAQLLEEDQPASLVASLVKDLGNQFENTIIETARMLIESEPSSHSEQKYERLLAKAMLHSPGFTLRGGTTEILRSIVGKGLGL
ncbi:acyl-CoA dehydrogenase family protein [Geomicrobium sp. JCM 19038]|uniref:acyl-CoA dehydrogenase family protein n=1 Tax=Geomicrobium sp. JCM 19038 TaxID=1460635 RepID=UPI00045F1E21|nr:acyl-CoA dehydrogenase family protein [Geomicrobium sp. JCM 19038]GAK08419.1 acyl-CoA dehydrogenase [Geomicrobium sp. JCM 19038]